jgi:hypothetical protein
VVIEDVEDASVVICVRARTRDGAVACPGCSAETARVHEYRERTAADVPVDGRRFKRVTHKRLAQPGVPGSLADTPGLQERLPDVLCSRRNLAALAESASFLSTARLDAHLAAI